MRAAIYCRVSTADQSCQRQERELRAYAKRLGCKVVGVFNEIASGAKEDRAERKRVMALAQAREIDAILVLELTRWGRSMIDLVQNSPVAAELESVDLGDEWAPVRPHNATWETHRIGSGFSCGVRAGPST